MPQPLINGAAYAWSQIELRLFNQPVAGIISVEYSDDVEMTDNYGQGQYPISRSKGKYSAKAKIELEMAEVVALQKATTTGRLQDISEFDIPISFLPEGGVIVTDTLRNCRFKTNGRSAKTGDAEGIKVELELQVSHITWAK